AMIPTAALAQPEPQNKPDVPQQDTAKTGGLDLSTAQDSKFGVAVIGLNPELRSFFSAPKDSGLLVARVDPGSPAAAAGIRVGDVITKLGTDPAKAGDDILAASSKLSGTQKLAVELIRDKKTMTVQVAAGAADKTKPDMTKPDMSKPDMKPGD